MKKRNLTLLQVLTQMNVFPMLEDKFIELATDGNATAINLENTKLKVEVSEGFPYTLDLPFSNEDTVAFIQEFQTKVGIKKPSKWQTIHLKDSIVSITIHEEVPLSNGYVPADIRMSIQKNT